jgi:Methyltransferase domain
VILRDHPTTFCFYTAMAESWTRSNTRRALKPVISVLDRRIERLAGTRARQLYGSEVIDLRSQVIELRSELERMRAGRFAVDLLLGSQGRRNSRLVSEAGIRELAAEVRHISGDAEAYGRVVQTYRMLFELELRGVGRLAGSARNVLGKLATTPLLDPPNGEVLEIGTLFGLFSGGMARQLTRIGLRYQLTIVDPLATVQLQDGNLKPDASGSPVTETVVLANLALAGVEPGRMRLIKGFSEDPRVQAKISDRQYGVIIVDGDHSQEGVARDLVLAERIAAPGAIVVIDDYGDHNWPGVERATSAHLDTGPGGTRFDLVGVVATSAFLRAR